jgi:formiminotetrahydrofolate cyclodeaminase
VQGRVPVRDQTVDAWLGPLASSAPAPAGAAAALGAGIGVALIDMACNLTIGRSSGRWLVPPRCLRPNTAALAEDVIQLARRIVDGANVNVLADIAAAVVSARAALETALIAADANLAAIDDPSRGTELSERMTGVSARAAEAERTVRDIRSKINR